MQACIQFLITSLPNYTFLSENMTEKNAEFITSLKSSSAQGLFSEKTSHGEWVKLRSVAKKYKKHWKILDTHEKLKL